MEIIGNIWSWIVGNISGLVIGALVPAVIVFVSKKFPKYLGGLFSKALDKGFENIDKVKGAEHALLMDVAMALVKYAEYKIPDKGKGKEKYKNVAAWLCKIFPFLKGREEIIADVIENSVAIMDEELKARNVGK